MTNESLQRLTPAMTLWFHIWHRRRRVADLEG
jgi:hypothetical protein